jgi:acetoacetyl-CoA reductase
MPQPAWRVFLMVISTSGGTMAKRVALITGGMGGLGETISTKMADAGYRVVVTYSPSNKTSAEWLSQMKSRGYEFSAYPCDVGDFDSCKACVEKVSRSGWWTSW